MATWCAMTPAFPESPLKLQNHQLQTNARITCLTVTDVNNGNGDGQDGTDQMEIENLGEIKNQMSKEKVLFSLL